MKQRSLIIVALIAVMAILLAMLGQDDTTGPGNEGTPLLPGLAAAINDVDEIKLTQANNDVIVTLRKTSASWSVAERADYPADVVKIRQALLALAEAKIIEEKTGNPEFYARLGVEAVDLESASGTGLNIRSSDQEFPGIILGDVTGTSYRYARRAQESPSYLIDRDPELARSTPQWLAADIIDIRSPRVQQVTIVHADGESVRISKASVDQADFTVEAIPDDRELRYAAVANVIGNALRELQLEDVEPASDIELVPDVTTEYKTFDGLVITISGFRRNEQSWISLRADFDAQQTVEFGTEPVAENLAVATTEATGLDPRSEAADINAVVSDWRYRVPSFQFDQMTRRMSDLLNEPD